MIIRIFADASQGSIYTICGEEIKEDESTSPFTILLALYMIEHYQEEFFLSLWQCALTVTGKK